MPATSGRILITGFGSEEACLAAFRGGVQDYLKKPIHLGDLVARVGGLLGTRRRAGDSGPHRWPGAVAAAPPEARAFQSGGIRRALPFIEAHLDSDLSLDQVAREAGMSKFNFCRHFKGDTGFTFREFLAHRRIAWAAELLRDGNRSVSEVYLDVGFKDLSHFGHVFRKITGQPPRYCRVDGEPPREEHTPDHANRSAGCGSPALPPGLRPQTAPQPEKKQEQSKKKQPESSAAGTAGRTIPSGGHPGESYQVVAWGCQEWGRRP